MTSLVKRSMKQITHRLIPIIGLPFSTKLSFPVIYYHDIVTGKGNNYMETNYKAFKEQMHYLVENKYKTYLFSEIENLIDKDEFDSKRNVMITFDDGFKSNYELVFPLMRELGLKFNIFICPKIVEDQKLDFLNVNMIKEMYNSGLVEFGSHTFSHIDVTLVSEEKLIEEVNVSNARIFEWLGYIPEDFCFPYGNYSRSASEVLANYYKRLYTSDCKPLQAINKTKERGRIGISANDNLDDFKNKLDGKYNVMYYYYRLKSLRRVR